ncbi:MAG TPA: hypothetical protein ENJ31_08980 [Anaerolineae bacterium]|nr:hypothetical protein [Anaerolineae bacterium]
MYRVPSEFIRQKNTLIGPVTVAHAVGAFGGFLLGQALDNAWVAAAGIALGLTLTAIEIRGLVLYRFIPLFIAYLVRRVGGEVLEPDEPQADTAPTVPIAIYDEEGRPIVWEEG